MAMACKCNGFLFIPFYWMVYVITTGIKRATFCFSQFWMYIKIVPGLHLFNNVHVQFARLSKNVCKCFCSHNVTSVFNRFLPVLKLLCLYNYLLEQSIKWVLCKYKCEGVSTVLFSITISWFKLMWKCIFSTQNNCYTCNLSPYIYQSASGKSIS